MRAARDVIERVRAVQQLPYAWPCPPTAAFARRRHVGSCASKHALLAEDLAAMGVHSLPLLVVGSLVPESLREDPVFRDGQHLLEVHECLTVLLPRVGPVRVDVTWDPVLASHGLPATLAWDGRSDMLLATGESGPGWAVSRAELRVTKEALRRRVYGPGERERRDVILGALSRRFAAWRMAAERASRSSDA